jgi:uncharacterized protein DUF5906
LRLSFEGGPEIEEKIQAIGEFIGVTILRYATRFKKAFFFFGKKDSGKSTIGQSIADLMPVGSVSAVKPQDMSDRFRLADLTGKILNFADEIPGRIVAGSENVKQAISGVAEMQAERKGQDTFFFVPEAGQLWTGNNFPHSDDPSDAYLDRLVTIRFTRIFSEGDPLLDRDLRVKIRVEQAQVVSWALRLAVEALRRGRYTRLASSDEVREDGKLHRPVDSWIADRTMPAPSGHHGSTLDELFEDYKPYAEKSNNAKMSRQTFATRISDHRRHTVKGSRYMLVLRPTEGTEDKPPRRVPPELQAHFDALVRAGVDPIALRALMPSITDAELEQIFNSSTPAPSNEVALPSPPPSGVVEAAPLETITIYEAQVRIGSSDPDDDRIEYGRVSGVGTDGVYIGYQFAEGVLETLATRPPGQGKPLPVGIIEVDVAGGTVRALRRASLAIQSSLEVRKVFGGAPPQSPFIYHSSKIAFWSSLRVGLSAL